MRISRFGWTWIGIVTGCLAVDAAAIWLLLWLLS